MQKNQADELLDQAGRLRGPWRRVLGALLGMGTEALRQRAAELDRACAEEGASAATPVQGVGWRCDAIPFLLTETEFSGLALGLAQRASLLEMVLQDVYGPRRLLADGLLPPALVYGSAAYLRACRTSVEGRREAARQMLHLYAADLVRGPDGGWCVIADRTGEPAGLAYALENRRLLARVLPDMFRGVDIGALRPFFDTWQDSLQRLAPAGVGNPGLALLTPGHADPRWFEHVVLARALGCALVEDEDLAVRGGALWIKTLRGLQPVHVLLRRQRGSAIDQLELSGDTQCGAPGLMLAWRDGAVRVLNSPGAGWAEAPGLGAFLPAVSHALTGRHLALDGLPTLWLGDAGARARANGGESWLITSATDSSAAVAAGPVTGRDWACAALAPPAASTVPCLTAEGTLDPRPMVLRLFLAFDGVAWRPLPGGLARVLAPGDPMGRMPPHASLTKDVWVLQEEGLDISGPVHLAVPRLAIRRSAGDLPSRVADNFYWLGRYLERLETAARLIRIVLGRLGRGAPLPRDLPDFAVLTACLVDAGIVEEEQAGSDGAQLADLLVGALSREAGAVAGLTGRVRDLADLLRDRLSGEMHSAMAGELRRLKGQRVLLRPGQRTIGIGLAQAFTGELLNFCATVAGYTAENMVRGGGRLFLDLGRRIERAQAVACQLAHALDQRPERVEAGLMLALELCDSALTYRARYLTAVQAIPVLDLLLADEGNPRSLACQLAAARTMMAVLEAGAELGLGARMDAALAQIGEMMADLTAAREPAEMASSLATAIRLVGGQVASVSDTIMRRYFAHLPVTFTDGRDT